MPTYDFICRDPECPNFGRKFESLLRHWNSPDPPCPACRLPLERQAPAPKSVWLKPWGEYGVRQKDRESGQYNPDGITVYRTKSTRNDDGSPQKCFLRTRQEVKTYCKDEGLTMPDEINPNATVEADGRTMKTNGVAGQWI